MSVFEIMVIWLENHYLKTGLIVNRYCSFIIGVLLKTQFLKIP